MALRDWGCADIHAGAAVRDRQSSRGYLRDADRAPLTVCEKNVPEGGTWAGTSAEVPGWRSERSEAVTDHPRSMALHGIRSRGGSIGVKAG